MSNQTNIKPTAVVIFKDGMVLMAHRFVSGNIELTFPKGEIKPGKYTDAQHIALTQCGVSIRLVRDEEQKWIKEGIVLAGWVQQDLSQIWEKGGEDHCRYYTPEKALKSILIQDPLGERYPGEVAVLTHAAAIQALVQLSSKETS